MAREDESIPQGRVQRTAKVGTAIGTSGARYAGTRARNLARSKDKAREGLDRAHMETAERMVDTLGTMKGAAMKMGQLASFIDTDLSHATMLACALDRAEWDRAKFRQADLRGSNLSGLNLAVLADYAGVRISDSEQSEILKQLGVDVCVS